MKMKYTDRKAVPMKWHCFLISIGLPVNILSIIFIMYQFITEMFFPDAIGHGEMLNVLIKSYDSSLSVSSPGILLWPLIICFLLLTADFILQTGAWTGLMRYKPYGKNLWLFLNGLYTCLFTVLSVLFITESREVLSALGILVLSGDLKRLFSVLLAILIIMTIVFWIFFILNIIYYHKRRFLFTDYYVQPVNENAVVVQTEKEPVSSEESTKQKEESKSEEPVREDTVKDKENPLPAEKETDTVSSDTVPEKSINQDEKTVSEETSESKKSDTASESVPEESVNHEEKALPAEASDDKETNADTADHEKIKEDNESSSKDSSETNRTLRFCPYCGHALDEADVHFCSHCGHKLD